MRFLSIKPISSLSRVVEVSGVGEAKTNISEMEMIKDLLEGHKKIIDMLSEVAEEAEAQASQGQAGCPQILQGRRRRQGGAPAPGLPRVRARHLHGQAL